MSELMERYEAERGGIMPCGMEIPGGFIYSKEYVAWLEAQLTWRPVSGGLPERQGGFFVRTPHSFPKNIPYQVAEFYDDNKTFYEEHTDSPLNDVTHWLPIPPAPDTLPDGWEATK